MKRKTALANSNAAKDAEQWAVNKALHYNEWADLQRQDFAPLVGAYRDFLACFDGCEAQTTGSTRENLLCTEAAVRGSCSVSCRR